MLQRAYDSIHPDFAPYAPAPPKNAAEQKAACCARGDSEACFLSMLKVKKISAPLLTKTKTMANILTYQFSIFSSVNYATRFGSSPTRSSEKGGLAVISYFDMSELKDGVTRQVYLALRRDILNWRLLPGRRLSEKDIAGRMNISKTPVREAFIKLQEEGLLEIRPQRGTFVSLMDMEQIEEVRFTRLCVESTVLSLFIDSPDENALSSMRSILDLQERTVPDRDIDAFVDYDDAFHREIFLACGKARTWSFIDHFSAQYKRLRFLSLQNYLDFGNVLAEHREILSACEKRAGEEARRCLSKHLNKILGESEHLREKFPEYVLKDGGNRAPSGDGVPSFHFQGA